jgi:hypothetical protein
VAGAHHPCEQFNVLPVPWERVLWCAWSLWRLRDLQSPQGEIGFLSDIRRMNVGMTRARRKLLLVGDSSTLCRHPFFWGVAGLCEGGGGYLTAREMVKHA